MSDSSRIPSPAPSRPSLVAVAHGTRSDAGTAMVRRLLDAVRAAEPRAPVVEAWVEAREPDLAAALGSVHGPAVVVPLLLSVGYHLRVDIPREIGDRPGTVLAPALGPDPLAARAVAARLVEARGQRPPAERTVLVAAGSSDPDALDDLAAATDLLARELGRPVLGCVLTAAQPRLADLLGQLDGSVEVANYLLADGYFARQLARVAAEHGAQVIAAPIGPHPAMVELVLARYRHAAAELAERAM